MSEEISQQLDKGLKKACKLVAEDLGIAPEQLGAKVWLLPQNYYEWIINERENLLVAVDWAGQARALRKLSSQLRMTCISAVSLGNGDPVSSGSTHAIGAGTIGRAIFHPYDPENPVLATLVHENQGSASMARMTRTAYFKQNPQERAGYHRRQLGRLSELYSTSVAAPLVSPNANKGEQPYGSVTFHTPRTFALDEAQIVSARRRILASSQSVSNFVETKKIVAVPDRVKVRLKT